MEASSGFQDAGGRRRRSISDGGKEEFQKSMFLLNTRVESAGLHDEELCESKSDDGIQTSTCHSASSARFDSFVPIKPSTLNRGESWRANFAPDYSEQGTSIASLTTGSRSFPTSSGDKDGGRTVVGRHNS